LQVTQHNGWRNSVYRAHLHGGSPQPRSRPNLTITTNAHANRVVLEDIEGLLTATGLEFWRRQPLDGMRGFARGVLHDLGIAMGPQDSRGADQLMRARVARGSGAIVLAAGAIGTPHLLMASGVGEGGQLLQAGVQPLHELPGVGVNLHDHLQVRASFRLRDGCTTLNQQVRGMRSVPPGQPHPRLTSLGKEAPLQNAMTPPA